MASASQNHGHRPDTSGGGIHSGVAVIGFVISFLGGAGLMYGFDHRNGAVEGIGSDSSGGAAWSDSDSPIAIDSKDPMWGKREAPVTIVQYSDFECPFCSRVEETMEKVKSNYGPEKVRIVWKNEPLEFHKDAKPTAEAATGVFQMAGSDAFWKFHKTAFQNQKSLTRENFEKWAQSAGVRDMAKFRAGLDSHKWASKVEDDHSKAKTVGVNGTPAAYINGVAVSGAQPFEKFKTVIDQELTKAQAKIASGTAKDKVYVAMTKENFKKEAPKEEEGEKEDTKTVWKLPVSKTSIIQGNVNAPVTVVLFSDIECPFCRRVEVGALKKVREEYKDKVRIVWKHEPLPFHQRAKPAANFAMEARAQKGDKGFWQAHDLMMDLENTDERARAKVSDDDFEKIATQMGLNVAKVKEAVKTEKYKKEIEADHELGESFQVQGTPHLFINGRRLVGAQPFEKFKAIIDEELSKANALVAKGTKDGLYEELTKDGKSPPPPPEPEKKTVAVPANAPFKGGAKAKVVIQQFSDFECPFCSRVEPGIDEIMKEYGDKVKLVWRNLPLPMHANAPAAAEASMEAFKQKGSKGFWDLHKLMFQNQKALTRKDLDGYAEKIGLDTAKFKAALDAGTHKAMVEADKKAGNDAGISGTPAFVINGYFLSGAQPPAAFKKLIDRALAEAK